MKVKRHMGLPFRAVWVDEDFNDLLDEKGCGNCYYDYFDEKAYPCSICIRGVEREDMWQPQTERSE